MIAILMTFGTMTRTTKLQNDVLVVVNTKFAVIQDQEHDKTAAIFWEAAY